MKADKRKSADERQEAHFTVHESLQEFISMLLLVYYLQGVESYFLFMKIIVIFKKLLHNHNKQKICLSSQLWLT